ncbi:class III extradiol dioxygenase subunit B-like domain-containing protein [Streptomyces sp. NPDC088354]|uniref:class III extradiol dioxygenase subunit B-like domain-containing protein n=1 Tax=unclassified Streptomyces TaxID=2593676 RepID=UPI0029B3E0F2|nr:class III extradiol dioxygenase subunit B-like domain-containing protein [Streptomyces sp. MI02-7b]MDX3072487.1 class III extradiol dioxygenase subunit B-like domain-containing protein [Streptomyces sp. MI02-7b]
MLVAAAVCPCPPLLVPEVASGASAELDTLRAACADALAVVSAARPDLLVVVGAVGTGESSHVWEGGGTGSLRPYGVNRAVRLGDGSDPEPLAPALTVAAALLEDARLAAPLHGCAVPEDAPAGRMLELGRGLAELADRVALLVMGDGSNCRTLKAPGYLDDRAEAFDASVARALGTADTAALAGLDAGLAGELRAAGRAPWQVLAGAAEQAALGGALLYDEAPYGVGYFVSVWS